MSRRNKRIWKVTGILLVILLILTGVLAYQKKSGQEEALQETAGKPAKEKEENSLKEQEEDVKQETGSAGNDENAGENEPVSLVFTGDVLLSSYVQSNYDRAGITGVLEEGLLERLNRADITIVNQEFPFSTRGVQAEDKQFTFRVNPFYVSVLQDMGVDMVTIANNHVLDFGDEALLDTMDTLEEAGILYAGAGKDKRRAMELQVMEVHGKKVGLLAASRVIPVPSWNIENHQPGVFCTYDPGLLLGEIEKAKEQCDYLCVYVHWGIERNTTPEDYQKSMARQYIDAGADAVIGSHPHVLQGIEFYQGKPIFYSLGNFVFNQDIASTMAVQLTIDDEGENEITLIPATAAGAKTGLLEEEEISQFYQRMEELSFGVTIDEEGRVSEGRIP